MSNRNSKKLHHDAIRERAAEALRDMYHNATPQYPHDDSQFAEHFDSWFADATAVEIDYIRSGGAYGTNYRATLEHPANAGKYQSPAARRYYIRWKMNSMKEERSRCNSLDSRKEQTNSLWELITEFGKLYTWGRGGRTLAPDNLIRTGGGSSFGIREDYADDMPIARVVELIRIVESFNRHVAAWYNSIPEQWEDYKRENLESSVEEFATLGEE